MLCRQKWLEDSCDDKSLPETKVTSLMRIHLAAKKSWIMMNCPCSSFRLMLTLRAFSMAKSGMYRNSTERSSPNLSSWKDQTNVMKLLFNVQLENKEWNYSRSRLVSFLKLKTLKSIQKSPFRPFMPFELRDAIFCSGVQLVSNFYLGYAKGGTLIWG